LSARRLIGMGVTAVAVGVVAFQFLGAAGEALVRTRVAGCKGMKPDPMPAVLQNVEAPDFELPDADGKKISLRSQRGHPVFLNFWATWCAPCTEEMPSMERLAAALEGTDIRTLAVSVDESWNEVKAFFAQGTKLGVLLDTSKEVPKKYTTEKYPETFLIDAHGRVRHYFINKRDWSKSEAIACLESLR
jgi:peroxiredoxin